MWNPILYEGKKKEREETEFDEYGKQNSEAVCCFQQNKTKDGKVGSNIQIARWNSVRKVHSKLQKVFSSNRVN